MSATLILSVSLVVLIAVGYPLVAFVCVRALALPPRQRRWAGVFLILYLVACGLGTHADIFLHIITDDPMDRADFAQWNHIFYMGLQAVGVAGVIATMVVLRARGMRLYATVAPVGDHKVLLNLRERVESLRQAQDEHERLLVTSRGTLENLSTMVDTDVAPSIRNEALKVRVSALRATVEMLGQRLEATGNLDANSRELLEYNRQQSRLEEAESLSS